MKTSAGDWPGVLAAAVVTSQKVTVNEMIAICEKRNSKRAEKAAVLDPPPSMAARCDVQCVQLQELASARLQALLGLRCSPAGVLRMNAIECNVRW